MGHLKNRFGVKINNSNSMRRPHRRASDLGPGKDDEEGGTMRRGKRKGARKGSVATRPAAMNF